jgi:hypothetical protein
LRAIPLYLRADFTPIFFSAAGIWHMFGAKIFDREELVPVLSLMGVITLHSLIFFAKFWSADLDLLIRYSQLSADSIKTCTHVWTRIHNKKQDTIKRHIAPLTLRAHEITPGNLQTVYSVEIMKKRMLWSQAGTTFQSIPYPTKDAIEDY